MDLKRNIPSKIQPPSQFKTTQAVNPLLNIANASTPVRTRVVKPSSQLNSTPVNTNKIGVPSKSPTISNKENDEGNTKAAKKPKMFEKNINLSPIMALNRKMSEAPVYEQRSFTPTGFRRQESLSNINKPFGYESKNECMFAQTLKESRNSNNFQSLL